MKSNAKNISFNFFLFFCGVLAAIVFFSGGGVLNAQSRGYLVPRQIYVGDPAAFVLPLPAASRNSEDVIITKGDSLSGANFPFDPDIDFHKIILERRTAGSRLIIEFTAFVPGMLEFPAIEIDGEIFTGLSVAVNSLINDRSDRVLSGAASALAMPGTALMLYGSMAAAAFVILLSVWFIFKGCSVLARFIKKWKRYRLFASLRNTEKRLQRAVLRGHDKRIILDELCEETREFLSVLTGENCRAMTARELELLPPAELSAEPSAKMENYDAQTDAIQAVRFGDFFRSCDELRFSGAQASPQDITRLLADLLLFADTLEKAGVKGKTT